MLIFQCLMDFAMCYILSDGVYLAILFKQTNDVQVKAVISYVLQSLVRVLFIKIDS